MGYVWQDRELLVPSCTPGYEPLPGRQVQFHAAATVHVQGLQDGLGYDSLLGTS